MNLKTVAAALIAITILPIPAVAIESPNVVVVVPWDGLQCDQHHPDDVEASGGVLVHTFVEPTDPSLLVTVHLLCALEGVAAADTDCTATAYSHTGWKWNSAFSGRLDTTNSYGFSSTQVVSAFSGSAEQWDGSVAADIFGSFSTGGRGRDAGRHDGVNQHGWKKLGGGGTIAVTYTWSSGGNAVESDAGYNTFYSWSLSGAAGKMDLENIVTHELGHTFGMGHTSTASANSCLTMYPYADYGETQKRTLGDGDIIGIRARYP